MIHTNNRPQIHPNTLDNNAEVISQQQLSSVVTEDPDLVTGTLGITQPTPVHLTLSVYVIDQNQIKNLNWSEDSQTS